MTTSALVALIVYLAYIMTATALCALLVVGVTLCWVTQTRREIEADDIAVGLVGASGMADGLEWCIAHYAAGRPS